jgi:aspartate/methionine/tyrosine aminotransferase
MGSTYLSWAKLNSQARYNLATSGIMGYPLSALPFSPADLEINGPDAYGYQPLQERLARKCGVGPGCVMSTNGTSMANHLAMAAILVPGDDVLIERPAYGLLLEVASYLGANVLRFDRRMEDGFQIDVDDLKKRVTHKTRLIVITNLHNPSGALTDESTLREIGEIAAGVGARVLVDEVYLDMVAPSTQTCFHLGDQFVVTNSLTKAYGLSGLRCGWILAEPKLTERIWRLNDLFNATPVHPGDLLSVIALDHLEQIIERTRRLLAANWNTLDSFLGRASGLDFVRPPGGTVIFPRLKEGDVNEFCSLLRSEYETGVVPGHFFEMPNHFRIGIGGDPEMTAIGLERLGRALDIHSGS